MMKQLVLALLVGLSGCSSRDKISLNDEMKGRYLFNLKLKEAYTKFLGEQVFKNGPDLYAGPAFIQFNNWQPIRLESLATAESMNTVYLSRDGSKLEYLEHHLKTIDQGKYLISFISCFKALGQFEKHSFNLVMTLKCKNDSKCTFQHAIDFFNQSDPYEFNFEFLDIDFFVAEAPQLQQFTSSESTAISNRFIFPGMGEKATQISIGHNSKHYIHGYHNVKFKNGFVQDFEFRFRDDLHFFNRN